MRNRKWAVALVGLSVLALALAPLVSSSEKAGAAGIGVTAGSYTYVVEGREASFPYDPITKKDGNLVPVEVFENEGFAVTLKDNTVTVSRNGQFSTLTLGSSNVALFSNPTVITPAPIRVSDHLFLPADLASHYGVDITLDGVYAYVHDNAAGQPAPTNLTTSDYAKLVQGRQLTDVGVRSDNNQIMYVDFTLLNAAIINDANFTTDPNLRVRALSLLPNYTLIAVNAEGPTSRSGSFVPTSIILLDQKGNEYNFTGTILPVNNQSVASKIIPGAHVQSILAFPKMTSDISTLTLWSDTNNGTLGSFTSLQ